MRVQIETSTFRGALLRRDLTIRRGISVSSLNRRSFLATGTAAGAVALGSGLIAPKRVSAVGPAFELPKLTYAPEALEPAIDKMTMEIHHDKHHAAYVTNLNKALAEQEELRNVTLEQMLAKEADKVPKEIRQAVINNGGGHYNHSLFWATLAPKAGGAPSGDLAKAIDADLGGFDKMKEAMIDAGLKRFGSGWSWLVCTKKGKLAVYSTANQDCPIMKEDTPIFGIDVWEHAYYLKYQNKRADYLKAIWDVANWPEVDKRLAAAIAKKD
jgi:superoxide dismutase, Fe-Mn family